MSGIPYTPAEDRIIKSNAGKLSSARIAELLPGRSKNSVKNRAQVINVSLRCYGEDHHSSKWSDEDVELCRKLHEAGVKTPLIAEKLELPYTFVRKVIYYFGRRVK